MKKRVRIFMFLLILILAAQPVIAGVGNNLPSGAHFNLNIIGVNDKENMPNNAAGHVIFVPLYRKAKIMLIEGEDFAVLDKNGTDGVAEFQLPNPDPDNDGVTEYSVFARALGKPGGKAIMTTGAYDPVAEEIVYSICKLEIERSKGKPRFENVSKELLYIYVDITDDDVYNPVRYNLFADELEDYFWDYDNNGLKILQLRFYPVSTTVPAGFPVID